MRKLEDKQIHQKGWQDASAWASETSRRMVFKMNIAKSKVLVVDNTPINVNNVLIENVQGYVYLGQHYSLKEKNQDKEIQQRIMAGWAAYAKHQDILPSLRSEKASSPIFGKLLLSFQFQRNIHPAHWKTTSGRFHLRQYWRKYLKELCWTGSTM